METQVNVWETREHCENYLSNKEISVDDVHYGLLSPGEKELGLLGNVNGKKVLEVCCGAAQNSIALTKWGAECTGVDISSEMLFMAKNLALIYNTPIDLLVGDAKRLDKILTRRKNNGYFDIALSSYGSCFVEDQLGLYIKVWRALKPGGLFVFCATHPLQESQCTQTLQGGWSEEIQPINQVVCDLDEAGFEVERIIEQTTRNPSQMTKEERQKYPYRVNNLKPELDHFCDLPHTIIYVCRKA